ncbi:MAG: protein-(glutamine-N5) methyltransferase, release factor-specific, partial [Campylobacterales bacterium]|nr:protein-(glutamine-N5) methyltransferase, release factor-specific [Campylobacterales bacterium]
MTIKETLKISQKKLSSITDRALFEAEILLSHFLKKDRIFLHTNSDLILENVDEFFKLIDK